MVVKFSLLCPSRSRLDMLEKLIQSLIDTTNNLEDIELLLAVDNEDINTQKYIEDKINKIKDKIPFKIRIFTRDRSDLFNRDYYNWLAHFSKGKYLWAIGNDVVFKIKNWDNIISKKIEDYLKDKPDRIVCVGVKDNTPKPDINKPPFSCFPIITRDTYDALGTFLHSDLNTWGADYTIYMLYTQIDRYFIIEDKVYLEHGGYHTKTTLADDLTVRMGFLSGSNTIRNTEVIRDIIPGQVKKIKAYMVSKLLILGYRDILKTEQTTGQTEHVGFEQYINNIMEQLTKEIELKQ